MKQRFSSLDVKAISQELHHDLTTLRLANIYDLSSRIFMLKFAKPDVKKQLIIDIGFKCHITQFSRAKSDGQSVLVTRLRKLLRGKRLTSVRQIGTDRIIEFSFNDGALRMFLEFFASGNIIVTDEQLSILAISRSVSEDEGGETQTVGRRYPLENAQNFKGTAPLTKDRLIAALTDRIQGTQTTKSNRSDLRKCLATKIPELPPIVIEHALQTHEIDNASSPEAILASPEQTGNLLEALSTGLSIVNDITASQGCRGYIFARRQKQTKESSSEAKDSGEAVEGLIYEDFQPFVPKKFREDDAITIIELKTFNGTVDQFFSSLEEQKLEMRMNDRAATAQNRLDVAKRDQEKRITDLKESQAQKSRMAAAIEANVERVAEAIDSVNSLLSQSMDWVDIGKLIEREKLRRNPIASIISLPLKLESNVITLMLFEADENDDSLHSDSSDESDSELANSSDKPEGKTRPLLVDISLALTPWGNAREYHDQRRTAAVKQEKTQIQSQNALRSAEQKIQSDLKKVLKQEKALLQPIRGQMWFEKFYWFISSDGYLVLAGRDPAQQELLYKRHLRYGDIFCHADTANASAAIIKNDPYSPNAPIPPTTLSQAGSFAVCSSSAWDSKAGMGSWWIPASQVSKLSPSGEVLPIGEFAVRGAKNHMPPGPLLLGLGLVFKISDTSRPNHMNNEMKAYAASAALLKEGKYDVAGETELVEEEEEGPAQLEEPPNPSEDGYSDGLPTSSLANTSIDGEKELHLPDQHQEISNGGPDGAIRSNTDRLGTPALNVLQSSLATREPRELKRGQKNKAKKVAMKYKDQDDEDKAAAVALLGTTLGTQRAEARAKQRADQTIQLAQKLEKRQAQKSRDDEATVDEEKKRQAAMEEGSMIDKDFPKVIQALSALVGTPAVGDEIDHLSVICAPISSLSRMKYKVKLQPGPQKKGKVVKEILERWNIDAGKKGSVDDRATDTSRMWPREVELIKALKAEDVVNAVPVGKARVMISGGSSAKGDSRNSNVKGAGQKKRK